MAGLDDVLNLPTEQIHQPLLFVDEISPKTIPPTMLVYLKPPFSLDIIYKFKNENKHLPPELINFKNKNKINVPVMNQTNPQQNPHLWRKHESKLKTTSWLVNNKLNQSNNDKISATFKEILNKLNKDNFEKMVNDI